MTSKPVYPGSPLRDILQEKENIRQTGVILHTREWDEEPRGKKRTKNKYVTSLDTPASRRRQKIEEPVYGPPTHAEDIARRNERERNRVRLLNESFEELRVCIPADLYEITDEAGKSGKKKLSKVEVLRLAVEYIQRLEVLLDHEGCSEDGDHAFLEAGIKIEKDFESESDVMDLSSDNRSRDDDHLDGLDMEDSVDKSVHQFYDEASLPPISHSFPGKSLPDNYSEIYVPFGGSQLKVWFAFFHHCFLLAFIV